MDTAANWATVAGVVVGVIGLVAFALAYLKSNLAKETIDLHEKNRSALEERVKILEDQHLSNEKKISQLEGEVRTLKTIPLEKLAANYEAMAKMLKSVSDTQSKMLELMSKTVSK